ncbi:MAG: PAS domain-containing protein [Burkholderiaceae bacterium]
MLFHPSILAPLVALALALVWGLMRPGGAPAGLALGCTALLIWALAARTRAQAAQLTARIAQLDQESQAHRIETTRSVAARAAAEADLRAAEERYMLALRGSQDGMWEWDLGSNTVHLSPRWKSMLGFDAHEIGDDKAGWFARVHPDDRATLEQALARHLQASADDAARFDLDLRLVHKDGSIRSVLSRAVAIRRESGAPYRMVGMDTDITRVKRLQTILDAIADGTEGKFGEDFFQAMVRHFARALDVDRAFITECADHPTTRLRTIAYWSASTDLRENIEFVLAGTPCEAVIHEGRSCFHREGLERMFPREAGLESYLGMPITASDGRVLGHLAFFDTRPRGDEMLLDSIYRIFLARAGAEMERDHAVRRLAEVTALA